MRKIGVTVEEYNWHGIQSGGMSERVRGATSWCCALSLPASGGCMGIFSEPIPLTGPNHFLALCWNDGITCKRTDLGTMDTRVAGVAAFMGILTRIRVTKWIPSPQNDMALPFTHPRLYRTVMYSRLP